MDGDEEWRGVWEDGCDGGVCEFFEAEGDEDWEGEVALEDGGDVAGYAVGKALGAAGEVVCCLLERGEEEGEEGEEGEEVPSNASGGIWFR